MLPMSHERRAKVSEKSFFSTISSIAPIAVSKAPSTLSICINIVQPRLWSLHCSSAKYEQSVGPNLSTGRQCFTGACTWFIVERFDFEALKRAMIRGIFWKCLNSILEHGRRIAFSGKQRRQCSWNRQEFKPFTFFFILLFLVVRKLADHYSPQPE
ncbi:hypothetical protein BX600DRAFT_202591 [Xylariales sp. PMI_506]|nr:hypothetical protein BX600DRAFT_202591 [Xylariales sp. PMI_506]